MVRRTVARRRRGGAARAVNRGSRRMYVPTQLHKGRMGLVMDELTTTRMYRLTNVSVTALSFSGVQTFQLNSLPNHAEFTALFDCYKIWKVDVTFIPKYNVSDFSTGGSAYGLPTLYVAEDRTTGGVPASINEIMEYSSCKAKRFDVPFKYTCWPQIIQTATSGSYFDDRQKDLWVRSEDATTPYLGLKWGLDLPVGVETFRMDIVFKYYMKFKDVK